MGLKIRHSPIESLQPLSALEFHNSSTEDPRLVMSFERIVVVHPTLVQVLPVLLPHIRSNGSLRQQIAMNRGCKLRKVTALESQKDHGAMPRNVVSGLVPLLELWPEFIRHQQVSEGPAL